MIPKEKDSLWVDLQEMIQTLEYWMNQPGIAKDSLVGKDLQTLKATMVKLQALVD